MNQREIKFRAWDGEKMYAVQKILLGAAGEGAFQVDGIDLTFSAKENIQTMNICADGCVQKVPHCKLMQYTGLKDKHGKEVYEGDIIACYTTDGHLVYNHEVTIPRVYEEIWLNSADAEVVGNVYESPELLQV